MRTDDAGTSLIHIQRKREQTSALNVRDQVSHPYETTSKTVVPYILNFTCF
jgi:hypothetical protein